MRMKKTEWFSLEESVKWIFRSRIVVLFSLCFQTQTHYEAKQTQNKNRWEGTQKSRIDLELHLIVTRDSRGRHASRFDVFLRGIAIVVVVIVVVGERGRRRFIWTVRNRDLSEPLASTSSLWKRIAGIIRVKPFRERENFMKTEWASEWRSKRRWETKKRNANREC